MKKKCNFKIDDYENFKNQLDIEIDKTLPSLENYNKWKLVKLISKKNIRSGRSAKYIAGIGLESTYLLEEIVSFFNNTYFT